MHVNCVLPSPRSHAPHRYGGEHHRSFFFPGHHIISLLLLKSGRQKSWENVGVVKSGGNIIRGGNERDKTKISKFLFSFVTQQVDFTLYCVSCLSKNLHIQQVHIISSNNVYDINILCLSNVYANAYM